MNNTLVNYFPVQFTKHANLAIFPSRLRPAPSSPRSPSRSSRRRSTGSRTSLSTRWRSSRPSQTSSTRPSPRCQDTNLSLILLLYKPEIHSHLYINHSTPSNGTNKFRQRAVHIAGHSLVSEKKNQYKNTQFQFEAIER